MSMNVETIADAARCELCGALRFGDGETDSRPSYAPVELLRRLVDVWVYDPVALCILLTRIAMPTGTYSELGAVVGRSPPVVLAHIRRISKEFPDLSHFARSNNAHAQSWRRGRKRKQPDARVVMALCAGREEVSHV